MNDSIHNKEFGMIIEIDYREASQNDTVYSGIHTSNLQTSYEIIEGNGQPHNPFVLKLSVQNPVNTLWKGIIRIKLSSKTNDAEFFMPAFMYGKNKGEIDRHPKSKLFPRLKKGSTGYPYSNYWMVRGDRLSHPVSMMYTNGYLFGISGSPYCINEHEKKIGWYPGRKGDLIHFNGFYCSLEENPTVGFTLGYENAPIHYIDGPIVQPRAPLSEKNCLILKKKEELNLKLFVYHYKAEDEGDISLIIKDQYAKFHQLPRAAATVKQAVNDIAYAIYRYVHA